MASAGRILIMPKGNYDATIEYEMLDLVFHNGKSWIAKQNVVNIEPTEANKNHWFKMCESADLTEIIQRIAALEAQMLGTISLDDIDLTSYATKTDLANYLKSTGGTLTGDLLIRKNKPIFQLINSESGRTSNFGAFGDGTTTLIGNYKASDDQTNLILKSAKDGLENAIRLSIDGSSTYKVFGEHNIQSLISSISGQMSGIKLAMGEYTGNGEYSQYDGTATERFVIINPGFEAKLIVITTEETDAAYDSPTIWVKGMTKMMRMPIGADSYKFMYFYENGNELKISAFYDARYMHNRSGAKYRWVAIG